MDNLQAEAEARREQVVGFCQRLIQTPSLPGAEEKVAQVVLAEMEKLGFDDVQVDAAGNVIGAVILQQTFNTYTGYRLKAPVIFPPFGLSVDHPLLTTAKATPDAVLRRDIPIGVWRFATDGGHLMAAGIPTIGFAPGQESLAHSSREHIQIDDLVTAVVGNGALARHLTADLARNQHLP